MKWSDMLRNKEKLMHFLTSQIVYSPNLYQVKDFFPKIAHHHLERELFLANKSEQATITNVKESVLKFCNNLNVSLLNDAETFVDLLSECSTKEDKSRMQLPNVKKDDLPTYRVIPESFPGNRTEQDNVTNDVLYWRLERAKIHKSF